MGVDLTSDRASSDAASVSSPDQITQTETNRSRLQTFVHSGHDRARAGTRAQVVLKLGEG